MIRWEAVTLTTTYFQEMMEEFGCKTSGRMAFGLQGEWPHSVELVQGGEPPQLLFRFVANGSVKGVAAGLKQQKLPHLRFFAEADEAGGVLVCLVRPPSDFYTKTDLREVLGTVPKALEAAGLAPPPLCPLCGRAGCDTAAFLNDAYRPTHAACLQAHLDLPEGDTTLPRRTRGHVLTGILGALVGALFGALPVWALALNNGVLHWALYAFIPILAGLVYRLFRGKANINVAGLCVLAASLLLAVALEQIWYWMVLSAQYGTTLPFVYSVRIYFIGHSFFSAVREMLFPLVALMIGFVATTLFLRRYANEGSQPARVLHGAVFVRESARPLDEEPPAAQTETQKTDTTHL